MFEVHTKYWQIKLTKNAAVFFVEQTYKRKRDYMRYLWRESKTGQIHCCHSHKTNRKNDMSDSRKLNWKKEKSMNKKKHWNKKNTSNLLKKRIKRYSSKTLVCDNFRRKFFYWMLLKREKSNNCYQNTRTIFKNPEESMIFSFCYLKSR